MTKDTRNRQVFQSACFAAGATLILWAFASPSAWEEFTFPLPFLFGATLVALGCVALKDGDGPAGFFKWAVPLFAGVCWLTFAGYHANQAAENWMRRVVSEAQAQTTEASTSDNGGALLWYGIADWTGTFETRFSSEKAAFCSPGQTVHFRDGWTVACLKAEVK